MEACGCGEGSEGTEVWPLWVPVGVERAEGTELWLLWVPVGVESRGHRSLAPVGLCRCGESRNGRQGARTPELELLPGA